MKILLQKIIKKYLESSF